MDFKIILAHQAGLKPFIKFWEFSLDSLNLETPYYSEIEDAEYFEPVSLGKYGISSIEDSVLKYAFESELLEKPKDSCCFEYKYSDLGYYFLKKVVEDKINQPLEDFVDQNFYGPLGLTTMTYSPLCKYPMYSIAPTDRDDYFRQNLLQGFVHDPGAAMQGGVGGHAGLFSNSTDLAKLFQMNLQDGKYGRSKYLEPGVVEFFATAPFENNRRAIGWDKPKLDGNGPTSDFASVSSFGHSGFTGTLAWADPEFDLIYIFLSNRIYPDAGNYKLVKNNIRTRIQDVVYESMWIYESENQY
jgi:CubicO group peptidase (beta-lactamase class C family)